MDPLKKFSNIIQASLKDNSLEKLNEYLATIETSDAFLNGKFMMVLSKILKKSGKMASYSDSEEEMECYYLVEFEDGVQLVHQKWIISKTLCYWPNPPYKSNERYFKAVEIGESPGKNWLKFDMKILGSYSDWSYARKKLKTAEANSDINTTDNETRTSRKERKRKQLFSESEGESMKVKKSKPTYLLPPLPATPTPSFKPLADTPSSSSSQQRNFILEPHYPPIPATPSSSNSQLAPQNDEIMNDQIEHIETCGSSASSESSCKCSKNSDLEWKKSVSKDLAVIKFHLRQIFAELRRSSNTSEASSEDDVSVKENFPLKNCNEFDQLEEKLLQDGFRKRVHQEKTLHVRSVLTSLQHLLNTTRDQQKLEKVSEDIGKLFELVFRLAPYIKEDTVIQEVVNVITLFGESVNNMANTVLKFSMKTFLTICLSKKILKSTRLSIMIMISSLLQKSSRNVRTEILPSTIHYMNGLSNLLIESDNYETQISIVEILARSLICIHEEKFKSLFSSKKQILEMFKKYHPFLNFDVDCRLFLNEVNDFLGDQRKVFSLPCMVVTANDAHLRKPNDPAYKDFWVDLNLGARSISFYYQQSITEDWGLMTVPQDKVVSAVAKERVCKSKTGERFEAVKLELTIDCNAVDPNSELPEKVKIYPCKNHYLQTESVIQQIFGEKYESKLVLSNAPGQTLENQSSADASKSNENQEDKSIIEISTVSKFSENEKEKGEDGMDKSKSHGSSVSEEDEESLEGSSHSRFIKGKALEASNDSNGANTSRGDGGNEAPCNFEADENKHKADFDFFDFFFSQGADLNFLKIDLDIKETKCNEDSLDLEKSCSKDKSSSARSVAAECGEVEKLELGAVSERKCVSNPANQSVNGNSSESNGGSERKCVSNPANQSVNGNSSESDGGSERKCVRKPANQSVNGNSSESNGGSKKERLYCFEKSNAEDVVMSYQDRVLSVEIPSSKLTKKGPFIRPRPNPNRNQISYSYITNNKNENLADNIQNKQKTPFDFEGLEESDKSQLDDSLQNDSDMSPKVFKESKSTCESKKFFLKKAKKDVKDVDKSPERQVRSQDRTAYSDISSPKQIERLKCTNTYSRAKPKKTLRRNRRGMQIESSDSDSEYVPPPKLLKVDDKENIMPSPKKTRFAHRVGRMKIDPIRDCDYTEEMEVEPAIGFEEPAIEPREIVPELSKKRGKGMKKPTAKAVQSKNTNAGKKKATKPVDAININSKVKESEVKKSKQAVFEKVSENLAVCMDVVPYVPPESVDTPDFEDLTFDNFGCNNDQQALPLHSTFNGDDDMVRFGKQLMRQIQEKLLKAQKLAQKEREMNLAKFDYKIRASCTGLYGSNQKMESVTDKLEKLNSMLQATYKLHNEIAAEINSEVLKVDAAKNELMKNVNKVNKTESATIASIFQGFGEYLKKVGLSFVRGNTNQGTN